MTLLTSIKAAGFPEGFEIIHLFEGGSKLHGARIEGKNDLDIYGIFMEPAEKLFGLDCYEHFVTSTSDNTRRNTAEDVDVTTYSLKRWAMLACKGNPTAINFLFALTDHDTNEATGYFWPQYMTHLSEAILARSAAGHYIGFADGQMKRLLGEKGAGKHGQRPELEQEFGFDTKAAMHAVRLLGEGIELMETGYITFPRPNTAELIEIRQGKLSLDRVCTKVSYLINDMEHAQAVSKLPNKPDRAKVNSILTEMYMEHLKGEHSE